MSSVLVFSDDANQRINSFVRTICAIHGIPVTFIDGSADPVPPEIAQYSVTQYPTVILLDDSGNVQETLAGYYNLGDYQRVLIEPTSVPNTDVVPDNSGGVTYQPSTD